MCITFYVQLLLLTFYLSKSVDTCIGILNSYLILTAKVQIFVSLKDFNILFLPVIYKKDLRSFKLHKLVFFAYSIFNIKLINCHPLCYLKNNNQIVFLK